MPLPAALAARLAKRGILSDEPPDSNQLDEEVIAEDYDVPGQDAHIDEFGKHLPPSWEKVWEPTHETWYYWDMVTDKVSWLPPTDLDAKITNPAPKKLPFAPVSLEKMTRSAEPVDYRKEEKKAAKHKSSKRKARAPEEFDPMDPSSYSDAPRGKWASGLKKVDDAKSGVDSTANGPLFQQRPYPSPGEVLSRNKQARKEIVGPVKPR
uniref:Polyglutamine-binding protein 1 n=1 Tax=Ciona savignyi TaxID=51511 RepID=H2Z1W0_CIOSA